MLNTGATAGEGEEGPATSSSVSPPPCSGGFRNRCYSSMSLIKNQTGLLHRHHRNSAAAVFQTEKFFYVDRRSNTVDDSVGNNNTVDMMDDYESSYNSPTSSMDETFSYPFVEKPKKKSDDDFVANLEAEKAPVDVDHQIEKIESLLRRLRTEKLKKEKEENEKEFIYQNQDQQRPTQQDQQQKQHSLLKSGTDDNNNFLNCKATDIAAVVAESTSMISALNLLSIRNGSESTTSSESCLPSLLCSGSTTTAADVINGQKPTT